MNRLNLKNQVGLLHSGFHAFAGQSFFVDHKHSAYGTLAKIRFCVFFSRY